MNKQELLERKEQLEEEIYQIDQQLYILTNLEKPYVANVSAYSGHYSMQYKTEFQARKKLNEYASKQYFKNGLNYGVYLYKWNEDGSKTLLESIPMGRQDFKPNLD
jgi:hypothetical protein